MEFKRAKTDSKEFLEAWEIYESSFPTDERRNISQQAEVFKNKNYSFHLILNNNDLIGIVDLWDLGEFILIEHFCIREDLRGSGFGRQAIEILLKYLDKPIVIEVEKPENSVNKRRVSFWEKSGFKLNNYGYVQPPYSKEKNPVKMLLMSYPDYMDFTKFSGTRSRIHSLVYGLDNALV